MEIERRQKLMVVHTVFFVIDSTSGTDPELVWGAFLSESTSK